MLKFTLRDLLWLVTVVAIVLGAWSIWQAEYRQLEKDLRLDGYGIFMDDFGHYHISDLKDRRSYVPYPNGDAPIDESAPQPTGPVATPK